MDNVSATVSGAQVQFFNKLLEEKDFGDKDKDTLRGEFVKLNVKSASAWIDAAMKLPKIDEADEPLVSPSF